MLLLAFLHYTFWSFDNFDVVFILVGALAEWRAGQWPEQWRRDHERIDDRQGRFATVRLAALPIVFLANISPSQMS
jgi:hypothetical protein